MADTQIIQSFICGTAVTEFSLVSVDANGKIAITTAGDDVACVGVAQRAAGAGEAVDVVVHGLTRVIAGGNIAPATEPRLSATTAGKVIATASAKYPVARILPNINQSSAALNDQILVLFVGPTVVNA
jgi:hypothetical protein